MRMRSVIPARASASSSFVRNSSAFHADPFVGCEDVVRVGPVARALVVRHELLDERGRQRDQLLAFLRLRLHHPQRSLDEVDVPPPQPV